MAQGREEGKEKKKKKERTNKKKSNDARGRHCQFS
jgi:hypothetical protein